MEQPKNSATKGYFEKKVLRKRDLVDTFQRKARAVRTPADMVADKLTSWFGTITFFSVNLIFFFIWILINTNLIPGISPFDPFPFGFLTMIVSLEAIFLSIVVLISQNRESKVSQLTDAMDMNIDLIAEEETTKVLELLVAIATKNGIDLSDDKVLPEMLKKLDTNPIESALHRQID